MISTAIQQLVNYGLDTGLILPDDEIYIRNQLLMTMQLDDFTAPEGEVCYTDLESILKTLVDVSYLSMCAVLYMVHLLKLLPVRMVHVCRLWIMRQAMPMR